MLIFAKYPQPGAVKTRMTPPLTPEEAAELHLASLRAVCENLPMNAGLAPVLVVTPDQRVDQTVEMLSGTVSDVWPQGEGDLGERLSRAADRAFEAGADRQAGFTGSVLLLGADSPTLPKAYVSDAINALTRHDAVLGPTHDGGYYLLGLRRRVPSLFDRIDWGTSLAADQTKERAVEAGVDLAELRIWYDLDRFTDLRRAYDDLSESPIPLGPAAKGLKCLIDKLLERYANG